MHYWKRFIDWWGHWFSECVTMPSTDLFHVYVKVLKGSLTLKTKPGIPSALSLLFPKSVKNDRVAMNEHSFGNSKLFLYMFNKEWA